MTMRKHNGPSKHRTVATDCEEPWFQHAVAKRRKRAKLEKKARKKNRQK